MKSKQPGKEPKKSESEPLSSSGNSTNELLLAILGVMKDVLSTTQKTFAAVLQNSANMEEVSNNIKVSIKLQTDANATLSDISAKLGDPP